MKPLIRLGNRRSIRLSYGGNALISKMCRAWSCSVLGLAPARARAVPAPRLAARPIGPHGSGRDA